MANNTKTEVKAQEIKVPEVKAPAANVRLSSKAEPLTVNGNMLIPGKPAIFLPSETAQRAGFFSEQATWLINTYPNIYKRPVLGRSDKTEKKTNEQEVNQDDNTAS